MILGTAGHIDHGKTSLIRALTGVDTDRLPEEKRRGITIELGFAPLELPGVGTIGVVDVPGHEAFVRTMLAGATGIDLALLVVAGDEGMMPQTREHLAILDLLGVSAGVVALTKADAAEPDWMQLVEDDVRDALAGGVLHDAPIVRCSAVTGAGLDTLRTALIDAARKVPARAADDLFRMPVDRVFTVRGTGTVVTGTVWSGHLTTDDAAVLLPAGIPARVRGIESHGRQSHRADAGSRAAIALGGVERTDVEPRGSALVRAGDAWVASTVLRADVALLDGAPVLGPRTRIRFHLGTADVEARLVAAGTPVSPGARVPVRVSLGAPVVARAGDRFVIRTASPPATIGGGVITDADPPRRRARPWKTPGATAAERVSWALAEAGGRGLEAAALVVRLGLDGREAAALAASPSVFAVGQRLYHPSVVADVASRCTEAVDAAHRDRPLDPGMQVQSLRSAIAASPELVDAVVANLVRDGVLALSEGIVSRMGWTPGAGAGDSDKIDRVLEALVADGAQPRSVDELAAEFGANTHAILKLLARRGDAIAVSIERYYAAGALAELIAVVTEALAGGRAMTTSELRETTGLTRKYVIPFLEYCDRSGVTVRRDDVRTLAP